MLKNQHNITIDGLCDIDSTMNSRSVIYLDKVAIASSIKSIYDAPSSSSKRSRLFEESEWHVIVSNRAISKK